MAKNTSPEIWKQKATEVEHLMRNGVRGEPRLVESLGYLSSLMYPLEGLQKQVVERFLTCFADRKSIQLNEKCIELLGRLVSSLITYQKVDLSPTTQRDLLRLFLSCLSTVSAPTELLYAAAALAQAGTTDTESHDSESLLQPNGIIVTMAMSPSGRPLEVQRAALHYITTLCQVTKAQCDTLVKLLELLLSSMSSPPPSTDQPGESLLHTKLVLSQLKSLHAIVTSLSSIETSPQLPNLLAILKVSMSLGLPGQSRTLHSSLPSALPVPRSTSSMPRPPASPKTKPQTVAGPQPRRKQKRAKERKERHDSNDSKVKNWRSQDSNDGEGGDPVVSLRPSGSFSGRGYSLSSSESELSDSEPAPNQMKVVFGKIRYQALTCLTAVFKSLNSHTVFSYWLTFLPDGGPRPPNSPPSLMTCILKDPNQRCRGGSVSVLCTLLEGSKVYLAPADDRPRPLQPFTPYSYTLGCVIRELHRNLQLAVVTENHSNTLTQLIKALSLLIANSPYHHLTEGYVRRVATDVQRYSTHRDTNVQVACLTCAGAIVSITPPLPEVIDWLTNEGGSPWIVDHCIGLLQSQSPLAIQTEALQVLTALPRFYFAQIVSCWMRVTEVCLSLLARGREGLQQHILKMLEELCRALSTLSPPPLEAIKLWEQLLSGPLTHLLQDSSSHAPLCSQSCSVLATIGSNIIAGIKVPYRQLTLTLPLSLCRDESSTNNIVANAVRVLGVFVSYDTLKKDINFLIDCNSAILHCLEFPALAVRVQASWALANFTDNLPPPLHSLLNHTLYSGVAKAVKDNDKVRCNGVRAAGNLLKILAEEDVAVVGSSVESLTSLLAGCINSGSVKCRWNSCYACYSALTNPVYGQHCSSSLEELVPQLCVAVQTSKNFKVRINAALALSVSVKYLSNRTDRFLSVWEAVLQGLESSEHQVDFSEYKHATTLKSQLFTTLLMMLGVLTVEQAELLEGKPLTTTLVDEIKHYVQTSKLQTADTSTKPSSEGENSDASQTEVVQKAIANLSSLCTEQFTGTVIDRLRTAIIEPDMDGYNSDDCHNGR